MKEGLLFGDQFGDQLGFPTSPPTPLLLGEGSNTNNLDEQTVTRFKEAVDDDFNFAGGLAVLFEIAKNLEKEGNLIIHEEKSTASKEELEQQWQTLVYLATVLGFEAQLESDDNNAGGLSDAEIDALVQQRLEAKKNKDYAQSDRIRDELQAQGITLIDKPGGVTIWNRG